MPTGYTAELMKKGMDFKSFVFQCARNFGALIMMRDDPMDAPIPDKFEPANYHTKALIDAQEKLAKLKGMTREEQIDFGIAEREADIKGQEEYIENNRVENNRLSHMAGQVRSWKPPTKDHEELKKFMLQQIEISKHDIDWSVNRVWDSKNKSPEAYYVAAVSNAQWEINYHTKENAEEIDRTNKRNEWIKQLRNSL